MTSQFSPAFKVFFMLMDLYKGIKTTAAKNRGAWRKWLEQNAAKEKSVWLIFYKKNSGKKSITYSEAVDEALCFGWIDSKPNKRDEESWYQFFTQRKPGSKWSGVNKAKVEKLIAEGAMTEAGLAAIELAKKNGGWNALDSIEKLEIPPDLQQLFDDNKIAFDNWNAFSKTTRMSILQWIAAARRPDTRLKRINETVQLAAENKKAAQYQPKQQP